jgi:hypothetical protein
MIDKLLIKICDLLEAVGAYILGYKVAKLEAAQETLEAQRKANKIVAEVNSLTEEQVKEEAKKYAR